MEPFLKELEQAVADGYSVKIQYHKSGKSNQSIDWLIRTELFIGIISGM